MSVPNTSENVQGFDAYSSKRVSFIVVTKDRAPALAETLERHRGLVQDDDELIVVDGNSSDHTREVAARFSDLIDVFIAEPDTNAAHALNKGILVSRGRYIKQLPDDDLIHAEGMEQAVRVLEEHPDVDLLVCGGTKQQGDNVYPVWVPPGTDYGRSVEDVFRYKASGVGFVIRRSAIARMGLHPLSTAGDHELVINAIESGVAVRFCRIDLFHHPIHDHSAVVAHREEHEGCDLRLIRRHCSSLFYYQWRVRYFLRRYPRLRRILGMVCRTMGPKRGFALSDCVWDGGFS